MSVVCRAVSCQITRMTVALVSAWLSITPCISSDMPSGVCWVGLVCIVSLIIALRVVIPARGWFILYSAGGITRVDRVYYCR